MKNTAYFLAFCNKYGISPCYRNKTEETLLKKIRESDFFIADDKCTHRIIGLYFKIGVQDPKVTVVCHRSELPLAKKLVFENNKKIYYDSKASAILFHNYAAGQEVHPKDYHCILYYYANFLYHYDYRKRRSR